MGKRVATALGLWLLVFAMFGAGSAMAAVATTDQATAVTTNSAVLHGTVATTNADSAWTFQYGTSTSYGTTLSLTAIGDGTAQVSATVTGLMPNTTYHFRLGVIQGSYAPKFDVGSDVTFTTAPIPGTVSVTGGPTSVMPTTAIVHGVANPVSDSSFWSFQFGTTTSYGSFTPLQAIATGLHALSITLHGLAPGTTYHYRLVVSPLSTAGTYALGADRTFRTPDAAPVFGRAKLAGSRWHVRRGSVALTFACTGAAGGRCHGKVSLSARGAHRRTVSCGSGTFSGSVGRSSVMRARIGSGCAALLKAARHHSVRATLKAVFTTHQANLKRTGTLLG